MKSLCSSLLLLFVVLASAVSAHAVAGVWSSGELTNFAISATPVPPLTGNESIGQSISPYDYAIGNSTSLVTDSYNFSTTTTSSDANSIYQNAIVSADMLGAYQADTWSKYDMFFTASTTGDIVASADFDLFLQAFVDNPSSESASGFSSASIYLFNTTQGTSNLDASQGLTFYSSPTSTYLDPLQLLGQLSTSLFFKAGESGSVSFMVEGNANASSVPEPSTFVLFGIGLAGAALLRRRARS